jgi:tetratricopeptide (TPR) repeat protein
MSGFFRAAVISCFWVGPAFCQSESLVKLAEKSQMAMEREKWEQALKYHAEAVSRFGRNDPYESYGAQFGTIFYRKGICEMKLKRWSEAMASFETCYRDFPNRGADQGNPFQKLALLKWGEAAMGAEQWEFAKSRFSKFVDERDKTDDVFPKGAFYVNLAICEYRLGNMTGGNENLEIAIHNKVDFPTPDSGIVAAFQTFVRTALEKKNEQALMDFIGKNRGELVMDQDGVSPYASIYLKLAGDVLASGMERAAILIYQLVPMAEGDPGSGIRLAALALIHERNGNIRGAFAAYQQLELYGKNEAKREDYLYHLIRAASLIGENDQARFHARRFLKDFPTSRHRGELQDFGGEDSAAGERPGVRDLVESPGQVFPKTREFILALDLYQGRKYPKAKAAFSRIKGSPSGQSDGVFAAFYEIECLRRMGNLEGMADALDAFVIRDPLGPVQRRQLEIDSLWKTARVKDWERLVGMTEGCRFRRLLDSQRAQVAYLEGLALQNLGRSTEALNAYNTAMIADAGASEELARQAAVRVMELQLADPEVRIAIKQWGSPEQNRESIGYIRLQEAVAVALLFESSLGAGTSLPDALEKLLNYKK